MARRKIPWPLKSDFSLPGVAELKRGRIWNFNAALTFVTTPNAPSGRGYKTAELEKLCRAQKGVVILDEAYVDFADENALELALKFPHVLVARTFSKAYSLCFQRVGYFVGHAELIAALDKIRDSYNVNGLGQIAAAATLDDLDYYRANFKKIISTREKLSRELTKLGFRVLPSQTNFILAEAAKVHGKRLVAKIARQKNSRPLVQRAGGEKLFAHHHWHGGGSGGFGQSRSRHFVNPRFYSRLNPLQKWKNFLCPALVNRDSVTRRATRLDVKFDVGELCFLVPRCSREAVPAFNFHWHLACYGWRVEFIICS